MKERQQDAGTPRERRNRREKSNVFERLRSFIESLDSGIPSVENIFVDALTNLRI